MRLAPQKTVKVRSELDHAIVAVKCALAELRTGAPGNALQSMVAANQAIGRAKRITHSEINRIRTSS